MRTNAVICTLLLGSQPAIAEEFIGLAEHLESRDAGYTCPDDEICWLPKWQRYVIDGWFLESGEPSELVVAHLSHNRFDTKRMWLVKLEPSSNHPKQSQFETDYLILDVEVTDHFLCTENPAILDRVQPDLEVKSSGQSCFSTENIIESIAK